MTGLKVVIETEDLNEEVVTANWTKEEIERNKNIYSNELEETLLSLFFEQIKIFIISKKIPVSTIRSIKFVEI